MSTLTECKEAALKLGESTEVLVRSTYSDGAYCFLTPGDPAYKNTIQFDPSGIETDRPARLTKSMAWDRQQGFCKNGTIHTNAKLVLNPP